MSLSFIQQIILQRFIVIIVLFAIILTSTEATASMPQAISPAMLQPIVQGYSGQTVAAGALVMGGAVALHASGQAARAWDRTVLAGVQNIWLDPENAPPLLQLPQTLRNLEIPALSEIKNDENDELNKNVQILLAASKSQKAGFFEATLLNMFDDVFTKISNQIDKENIWKLNMYEDRLIKIEVGHGGGVWNGKAKVQFHKKYTSVTCPSDGVFTLHEALHTMAQASYGIHDNDMDMSAYNDWFEWMVKTKICNRQNSSTLTAEKLSIYENAYKAVHELFENENSFPKEKQKLWSYITSNVSSVFQQFQSIFTFWNSNYILPITILVYAVYLWNSMKTMKIEDFLRSSILSQKRLSEEEIKEEGKAEDMGRRLLEMQKKNSKHKKVVDELARNHQKVIDELARKHQKVIDELETKKVIARAKGSQEGYRMGVMLSYMALRATAETLILDKDNNESTRITTRRVGEQFLEHLAEAVNAMDKTETPLDENERDAIEQASQQIQATL